MSPRKRRDGFSFNGVQLGLGSPLREVTPRRRYVGPSEFQIQSQAVDLLRGPIGRDGFRPPGGGLSGRYPELNTLYAIPNGGHRLKLAAGRARAEGALRSASDLVLPAPRYPFHGLYLEVKTPDRRLRIDQRAFLLTMIERGYAGTWAQSTQEILDLVIAYLELPAWPDPPVILEQRQRWLGAREHQVGQVDRER